MFSATKGKADVRYGADNKDAKRLDAQQTPFAVEAQLSPQNNYLSVGASAYDAKALLMCRIYLDDTLAYQEVSTDNVSCSLSRNLVSETRATFEVYSSVDGGTVDLRYSADGKNQSEVKGQKAPLGIQAALPSGSDYLSYRASSYDGPPPYLMCRLYLDGVLVNVQQGYRYVSCDTSLSALYG